jgi:hypothetical protein
MDRIQCKVSSDADILNELHDCWRWIPGKQNIRPTDMVRQLKIERMNEIMEQWKSYHDYILFHIFKRECIIDGNDCKYMAINREYNIKYKRFLPNEFPYQTDGNHWVMWYCCEKPFPDEMIQNDIYDALFNYLGHEDFQFAWYVNPKMTIPEFFHVQVFWLSDK